MSKLLRVGGVPEHFNLPWHLAIEDEALSGTGATVRFTYFPAGTGELTRALRARELDVALVLTEGAVADILQHDRNRLVKVYVDSPLIWGIHVAATSPIKRIADIRDKRIAISRYGSGSHLIAIVDAAERGWSTADMTFVIVNDLQGARAALASGEADIFLWERHMTQPLVDSGEFRRVGQRVVPWPAFAVSVRRGIIKSRAADLRSVLDIVCRYARNLQRRQTAADEISTRYDISPADAKRWLRDVHWCGGYRRPAAALERVVHALQSQQVIAPGPFDADRIWHQL